MPLTRTQVLRRLCSELQSARQVLLLGTSESELRAAASEAQSWRPWSAGDGQTPPDTAVVEAAYISAQGDLALHPAANAAARSLTGAAELLRRTPRVLALVTQRPSSDSDGDRSAEPSPPWLVGRATDPFATGVVSRVVSSWALVDVTADGLVIGELAPDVSASQLQAQVGVGLKIRSDVAEMSGAMLEMSKP